MGYRGATRTRQGALRFGVALLAASCGVPSVACDAPDPPPPPHATSPAPGIDHRAGADTAIAKLYYGVPILQKSIFWDGNGEDDTFGPGIAWQHYVADGLALGLGIDTSVWKQTGHDAYSAGLEGLLRWYPVTDGHVFVDLAGGYMQATQPVPTGGTEWNYTFEFGPGVEVPVSSGSGMLFGATYHHTSNALGPENPRNPSQNEVRFWVGYGWSF